MGKTYDVIDPGLAEWLEAQPVFFVATAPLSDDGLVNCSPKGNRQEFVVVGARTVAYLDLTGSGVETIAHLRENGRIVVMFCAFTGPPRIVRFHGTGEGVALGGPRFNPGAGARAVVVVSVERISDSCGYGVPIMEFQRHRDNLDHWADTKGAD